MRRIQKVPAKAGKLRSTLLKWSARCRAWFRTKNPILIFVGLFVVLLAAFYAVTLSRTFQQRVFPAYLSLNARASNALLNVLGQKTRVEGRTIHSAAFSIDIRRGCDAVDPMVLFAAALLAFPAPWQRKLPGLLGGLLLLAGLNLVRIVSLFLVGRFFPNAFDLMHLEVWQALFIALAVVTWAAWIRWALKSSPGFLERQGNV